MRDSPGVRAATPRISGVAPADAHRLEDVGAPDADEIGGVGLRDERDVVGKCVKRRPVVRTGLLTRRQVFAPRRGDAVAAARVDRRERVIVLTDGENGMEDVVCLLYTSRCV